MRLINICAEWILPHQCRITRDGWKLHPTSNCGKHSLAMSNCRKLSQKLPWTTLLLGRVTLRQQRIALILFYCHYSIVWYLNLTKRYLWFRWHWCLAVCSDTAKSPFMPIGSFKDMAVGNHGVSIYCSWCADGSDPRSSCQQLTCWCVAIMIRQNAMIPADHNRYPMASWWRPKRGTIRHYYAECADFAFNIVSSHEPAIQLCAVGKSWAWLNEMQRSDLL